MNKAKQIAEVIVPVVEEYIADTIHWQIESELTNREIEGDEINEIEQQIYDNIITIFYEKYVTNQRKK